MEGRRSRSLSLSFSHTHINAVANRHTHTHTVCACILYVQRISDNTSVCVHVFVRAFVCKCEFGRTEPFSVLDFGCLPEEQYEINTSPSYTWGSWPASNGTVTGTFCVSLECMAHSHFTHAGT